MTGLEWKTDSPQALNYMNFYMDKTKRILQANGSDPTKITVQGATFGPIPMNVGGVWFVVSTDQAISTITNLDTGSITPGKDYYIYACNNNGVLTFLISLNTTYPTGYTASTSRKIGGFHTLCADVGTISGHLLTGFTAGQILPQSVWDLKFRAACLNNAGLVYDSSSNLWVQIYMASDNGASGVQSVYGATILDTLDWNTFVDKGGKVGLRLLHDDQFQLAARNCNELTNVYGSLDPVTTGKMATVNQTTGSGLNDITLDASAHTLGVSGYQEYEITIDAVGTPDTFKWRQRLFAGTYGSFTTGVAITGAYQTLANGVKIKFNATTGHTLNNVFNVWVSMGNRDTANRRMVGDIGMEDPGGIENQWTLTQSYQYNMAAANIAAVTAAATITAYYAAAPGGNPIYMKFGAEGIPYLCSNMADTVDHILTFGTNQKLIVKHDAGAGTGGYQIYMNRAATDPGKIIANIANLAKTTFIQTANYPDYYVQVVHDATASSDGVALYYNTTNSHLEAIFSNTANNAFDISYLAPAWAYYVLPGSQGSIYRQGDYGDVKLIAGGSWAYGTNTGSRDRHANDSRSAAYSTVGGRFASEPI
jgi:hypothetical protein